MNDPDPSAGPDAHAASPSGRRQRVRYIPALDGIRALAVITVVLYHLNLPWMQGGLLGVTVFFVLSGFLITRLLLAEFDGSGRIDLKSFWLRRIRRLLPAIVAVVVVTAALCTLFNHVMLTKMRPDIVPSLLFFNNWWQIAQNVSYFDALGDPSPLTHFWSLAIEEQFYLVWPPILLLLLKCRAPRPTVRRGVLAVAAVSALTMALLYNPAGDPSRVYYGTDTRVFSLLLGAWLALAAAEAHASERCADAIRRLRQAHPASLRVTLLDLIGIVALGGLIALAVCTNGYTAFQYRGGTLLCTLLALILIAACVPQDSLLGRALSTKPLRWLGTRSYGIYLWHFPLLSLLEPVGNVASTPWWAMILHVGIVLLVAEASYRFIEEPFRRGALGLIIKRIRAKRTSPVALARRHLIPLAATALVVLIAAGGLLMVPDTSALSAEGAALLQDGGEDGQDAAAPADDGNTDADADAAADTPASAAYDLVMIGDSVSVRAVPAFQQKLPHGYIDAAKNRQFSAGIDIYRSLVDQGAAGPVLVFALGTNGPVSDAQIDELVELAGPDRTVAFVTTRSPQPWVSSVNDAFARAAERHDNVRIVDWYAASEGRNDLFDGDGTHLNDTGAATYIDLIYQAVRDLLPLHLEDESVRQDFLDRMRTTGDTVLAAFRNATAATLMGTRASQPVAR